MKETPPEKKAAALAGLAAGKSVRQVAEETGLGVGTIGKFRTEIPETLERIRTEDRANFGGLLALHFQTQAAALNNYATHTSTQEYIRANTASDMASLYGAVSGHVIRILDIASRIGSIGQAQAPAEE